MPVETAELESGICYYWRCPVCSEISLPFKNVERAQEEVSRHERCLARSRARSGASPR
jgi:hypothetical protein